MTAPIECKNVHVAAPDPDDLVEVTETCWCGFPVEALPEDMRTAMLVHQALTHAWPPIPLFVTPSEPSAEETDRA